MPIWHLVSQVRGGGPDLTSPDLAPKIWRSLRRTFPLAFAAALMPDHAHLIHEQDDPDQARRDLARALSRGTYGRGKALWRPAPSPDLVRSSKLGRVVRYVALNPCRASLAADPLEWSWSTYRDVIGATVDPWIDAERMAATLGRRRYGFRGWFHRYVSSDFAVSPGGTDFPRPAEEVAIPTLDVARIMAAVAAAFRRPVTDLPQEGRMRDVFAVLAREQGWRQPIELARAVGVDSRTIRRAAARVRAQDLEAARLCLGDARLLDGRAVLPHALPAPRPRRRRASPPQSPRSWTKWLRW